MRHTGCRRYHSANSYRQSRVASPSTPSQTQTLRRIRHPTSDAPVARYAPQRMSKLEAVQKIIIISTMYARRTLPSLESLARGRELLRGKMTKTPIAASLVLAFSSAHPAHPRVMLARSNARVRQIASATHCAAAAIQRRTRAGKFFRRRSSHHHDQEEIQQEASRFQARAHSKGPDARAHLRNSVRPRARRLLPGQSQRQMGFEHGLSHAEIPVGKWPQLQRQDRRPQPAKTRPRLRHRRR